MAFETGDCGWLIPVVGPVDTGDYQSAVGKGLDFHPSLKTSLDIFNTIDKRL